MVKACRIVLGIGAKLCQPDDGAEVAAPFKPKIAKLALLLAG
jgi:hypothetical protein